MPKEMLETIPGYGPDVNANREEARKLMQKAGYGPDKHLAVKVSTRNIAGLPRSRRDPDRPAQEHLYRWRARRGGDRQLVLEGRAQGLCARPQPHRQRGRRSRPVVLRELFLRFGAQLHQLLQQGHREDCSTSSRRRPISRSARSWCGTSTRSCRKTSRAQSSSTAATGTCWQPYVKGVTVMVNSSYNGYRYEDVWLDK